MTWFPYAEHPLYTSAVIFVIIFGALSMPLLFFVTAPYGRHFRSGWGPSMPAKLGWILMEAPSPLAFAVVYFQSERALELAPLALLSFFQLHYLLRSFVFPLLMRGKGKKKPVLTVALAVVFNLCNGATNAFAITELAPHLWTRDWLTSLPFVAGSCLFLIGFAINQHSDHILRTLRKPGENGYKVPNRGLHRLVAAPNYFGELLEWLGFAIAACTLPALVFFFFSVANLLPRAVSNRRWYRETFDDYPKARRALIPFVL